MEPCSSLRLTEQEWIPPSGRNFTGDRNTFMNQSFFGAGNNRLLVQIAYTDVFGVRQTVQKQVNLSSGSTSGFSSRSTTQGTSGTFPGGFSSQSQSSDLGNSIMYIVYRRGWNYYYRRGNSTRTKEETITSLKIQ